VRSFTLLPLLLASLGAETALAQSKPVPDNPPASNGKKPAAARVAGGVASNGDRAAEAVAPVAKPPDPPATPAPQPAQTPAKKPVAPPAVPVVPAPAVPVAPAPANAPGAAMLLPPVFSHPDTQYPTTARVAVTEFQVTGEDASRALAMRLQDGFVVGLTRTAPIYVLDSVDVARYIDIFPELQQCEGSMCIKRLGQMLDVSHVVRVTVSVTGNSYDMTARLFSTESLSPAGVPIDTQTRFCPVCTVDEARQKIIQLGDSVKNPVEAWLAQQRPPPTPPPPPSSWRRPLAAGGIALGFATVVAGGALLANVGHDTKKWPAVAGALIGIGASAAVVSCYVLIAPAPDAGKPALKVALGGRF
jgi:TolB-like protein